MAAAIRLMAALSSWLVVRGKMPGGLHTTVFRPTEEGGVAGVYFVRMRAESFESTQKIVHFVR